MLCLANSNRQTVTFIQEEPFYTSQNVVVLIPKEDITFEAKQFIATAIFKESQNNYRAFIKELNAHIKRDFVIKLPTNVDGTPDYEYMTEFVSKLKIKSQTLLKIYNMCNEVLWQSFIYVRFIIQI